MMRKKRSAINIFVNVIILILSQNYLLNLTTVVIKQYVTKSVIFTSGIESL